MLLHTFAIWIFPDSFNEYSTTILVALVVIGISIFVSIVVYLTIFISRVRATYIQIRTAKARELISDKLNNYLFVMESVGYVTHNDFKRVITEFNKIKRLKFENNLVRQLLIDQLIYFRKNFTSTTSALLRMLYQNLGLKELSSYKLNDGAWEIKAQGIAELREMESIVNTADILPYTKSCNDDLRVEAQAAYIGLNSADPFSFLGNTPELLVEWHQIILFDAIAKNEGITIPSFTTWLNSPNTSVVIFCIKLIVQYTQIDAIPNLILLLHHPDEKVQNCAINALGKLGATAAEQVMIDHYTHLSEPCKLEVLKALGRIKGKHSINFLRSEFINAESFYICKYAMYAILAITKQNKAHLLADLPAINTQQRAIIDHCFDKLINA